MLFWMARRTVRGLTRTRRYRRCDNRQSDWAYRDARTRKHGWILLAILSSPLWIGIGLILIAQGVNATITLWHLGPWYAATIVAVAVVALGGLYALRVQRRTAQREKLVTERLSPRVNRYYTCCGLPAGQAHATTCHANRRPPENPAHWSDRR